MIKFLTWFSLFVGLSLTASAQYFAEEHWHQGRVELNSGEVYEGRLRYELDENLVQFKGEGLVRNFNPTQVEYFQFYDEVNEKVRHFYTLKYERRPQFFELVYNGEIALLNREQLVVRYFNGINRFAMGPGFQTVSEIQDNFYLLFPNLEVRQLPTSRRAFIDELPAYHNKMDLFMKEQKIRLRQPEELIRALDYYDRIANKSR